MFKRIDHIALHVNDLTISKEFYIKHFEFKEHYEQVTPAGTKIVYLKLGDTILELVGRNESPINGFQWCIETTDFDQAVSKLAKDNVEILQQPHPTDPRIEKEVGWRRVVFKGPDGEQIELRG